MRTSQLLVAAAASFALVAGAAAGEKEYHYRPFELALFTPVNIFHPENKVITGLNLNIIYGRTTSTYGLEIGALVNSVEEDMVGLQVAGLVNKVGGRAFPFQFAGIANVSTGWGAGLMVAGFVNWHAKMGGIQLTPILNWVDEHGAGLQVGGGNVNAGSFDGVQVSLVNYNAKKSLGLQLGPGNLNAEDFTGLQVGGFNLVLGSQRGVQIALFNLNNQLSWVVGSCGVNCNEVETTTYIRDNYGLQLSLANFAYNYYGVRLGAGAVSFNDSTGLTVGAAVAWTTGSTTGLQLGAFNYAGEVHGLQIGAVNVCKRLKGVQLGAVNVATENTLPVMVVVNAGW